MILAIDLGLKFGFALYSSEGKLLRYGSHNFGATARMKRAAWTMLREPEGITHLVVEGGGKLEKVWTQPAEKLGIHIEIISAETWRRDLLLARDQRSGEQAKARADELARNVISSSALSPPKSLRHDAAEAILVGFWQLLRIGWLDESARKILQ